MRCAQSSSERLTEATTMKNSPTVSALVLFLLLNQPLSGQEKVRVLTNHIGYETSGPKHAVVQGADSDQITRCRVLEYPTDRELFSGVPKKVGPVKKWKDWS